MKKEKKKTLNTFINSSHSYDQTTQPYITGLFPLESPETISVDQMSWTDDFYKWTRREQISRPPDASLKVITTLGPIKHLAYHTIVRPIWKYAFSSQGQCL